MTTRTLSLTVKRGFLAGWALITLAAAGSALAADADQQGRRGSGGPMKSQDSMSQQMHRSMMQDMKHMDGMRMTGDVDYDFAAMMRRHHESGVRMAEMQLRNGKDDQMKKMASKMIDSQKKEIEEFDRWMREHKPAGK